MATETTFLGLILPGLGEYTDSWDVPVNANSETIDVWAAAINGEVTDARSSKPSLKAFLDVAHTSTGALQTIPDIAVAQNSPVYGDRDPGATDPYTLSQRLNFGDMEVFNAREGQLALRDALAKRQVLVPNMIVSGTKSLTDGSSTWLSAASNVATIVGDVTPIWFMIDGYLCRTRTRKSVTITGGSGWYYLYVDYQPTGSVVVDGDSRTPPPSSATGSTTIDPLNQTKCRFNDPTHYFSGVLKDVYVQVGDILTIFPPSVGGPGDAGNYIIKALGTGDDSTLQIVGVFPGTARLSGLDYKIRDPFDVTLGFSSTQTETPGRLFIGEVYLDSGSIPQDSLHPLRPYHFKDTYVGDWKFYDVGSPSPTVHEAIWEHRLGSGTIDISVQVSQTNDGLSNIEELSLAGLTNSLGTSVTQPTISVTQPAVASIATPSPPTIVSTATGAAATASGCAVALTGTLALNRSAAVKWTRNQIYVKNATPQLLYTDYDGVARTSGYVRVVVRKRG